MKVIVSGIAVFWGIQGQWVKLRIDMASTPILLIFGTYYVHGFHTYCAN